MHASRSTRFLYIALAAAMIALWPLTAQTFQFKEVDPSPASDPEWAPVSIVAGQNVRLNLANVAVDNPDYTPGACQVEVRFLDAAGQAIGDGSVLELRPGQSATVMGPSPHMRDGEIPPDIGDRTARLLRPTVRFVEDPNIRGRATRSARQMCSVVPAMEVFSEETGATLFLSPAVLKGFNPQPDPPGHLKQAR